LQWRCSYYIQSITSKCIFLKESLWIYRVWSHWQRLIHPSRPRYQLRWITWRS
jgi:hypothetical protein